MTPTMEEVAGWLREAALSERAISLACLTGLLPARFKMEADERSDLFDSRASQVEAMGWRPIEEAPRTGEEVDLWDDFAQDRITDCKWMKNAWHRWEPNAFETMDWCRVHGKLTHFMRKPQPPCNFGKN